MKTTHKLIVAGIGSAILLGGGGLVQGVFAQGTHSSQGLVALLSQKFDLKQSDVQAVFDQYGQLRQAEQATIFQQRLDQAVTDGKLTAAQKDLILAKEKEVLAALAKDKAIQDPAARKAAIQQLQADLKTWASQNKIDGSWLRFAAGRPAGHGGKGMTGKAAPTATN